MTTKTVHHFSFDDPQGLLELVKERIAAESGWINVVPDIHKDVPIPATPTALAVFSKRGPVVPLGTWVVAKLSGRTRLPNQLGIQHGIGSAAKKRLSESVGLDPTWRVTQDHPRRGLVVELPPDQTLDKAAEWLLASLDELCIPPHTGKVNVVVYRSD